MINFRNTKRSMIKSKKAFTLVELVVVIAILAMLSAIAIPVVANTIRSSQRSAALSDAHALELALKEADAMIKAGDRSVYTRGVNTTVADVVAAKSLQSIGLSRTTHFREIGGARFNFKWDPIDEKCYFPCSRGGNGYMAGQFLDKNIKPSSTIAGMTFITTDLTVESLF
jgi:type IV pilus assembly protein PilA